MHPDLIARTCGSIGVLGALVFIGIIDTPKFIITPQQNFESVLLTLNVAPAHESPSESSKPIKDPEPPPEPIVEPPALEPAPVEQPVVEPPPPPPPPMVEKPQESAPQVVEPPKSKPKPKKADSSTKIDSKDKAKAAKAKASAAPPHAAPASPDKAQPSERKINAQLASLLVKEIKSKLRYPRNAVRRKLEGTVMVEFMIKNGVVVSYNIEKSSGHKILDEAAGKLAKSLMKFNTRLDAMSNRVLIPIKYELL